MNRWIGICMLLSCCLLAQVELRGERFVLRFEDGKLWLLNAQGQREISIGNMDFAWCPPVAVPLHAEKIAEGAMDIGYRVENDADGKTEVQARVELTPFGFDVTYAIRVPDDFKGSLGGVMQEWAGSDQKRRVDKIGIWKRSEKGGVPYEEKDCYLRRIEGVSGELDAWYVITGNVMWGDTFREHLKMEKTAKEEGIQPYQGKMSFVVTKKGVTAEEVAARRAGRPLCVALTTDRPFNIFSDGMPLVTVTATNCQRNALSAAIRIWARNFDGTVLAENTHQLDLAPDGSAKWNIELPLAEHDMAFVEASAVINGTEIFSRSTVATLPPFLFKYLDKSNIGISAFFNVPSREEVFRLMQRLGVHYVREGDSHELRPYGMVAMMHNNVSSKQPFQEADAAKLDGMVEQYRKRGNVAWEFCNEWNFVNNEEERTRKVNVYLSWVKEIMQRKQAGADINLVCLGLGGADPLFQEEIAKQGGWDWFDAVALHPGRGNVTPDDTGEGWTYLGAIRRTKAVLDRLGVKPLYLTEVYACTQANNWWVDSMRQSAENTILTFAIGKAEGMAAVLFYQMHNGVWFDVGGININDREYDFGLLNRDCSPKPSLMAFATIAEELDGAEFVRYVERAGTALRGMEFVTPTGRFAVLYDRTDGTLQSVESDDFIHLEPWITHWKTKTSHVFKAKGDVVVRDCIGRRRVVTAVNGQVTLALDGAPLIVHGLELE